jgi:hypothetical protein
MSEKNKSDIFIQLENESQDLTVSADQLVQALDNITQSNGKGAKARKSLRKTLQSENVLSSLQAL